MAEDQKPKDGGAAPVEPVQRYAYTVREAAAALGLGHTLTGDLVRAGRIRAVHVGKRILIPRWAIEEFLKENAE
ncbi:MAG: DNA-binding protein [Acidobacteria bacterium]|nr:MAG: DNA-binding protein [Acidobacteriota bacterium]